MVELFSLSLGYVHTKPDKLENATFFFPYNGTFENALQSG